MSEVLDLFAGPGGWDEGLKAISVTDVVGIDTDKAACATAEAAGHARIRADVRKLDTETFAGISGLIASPPCQTFSDAGKRKGVASLSALIKALQSVSQGQGCAKAVTANGLDAGDLRTTLVLEPMRFIRDLTPQWVAFEEVKQVLPVWEGYAALLRQAGYSAWAGILNAADYGVPQSRKRAFLIASRTVPAGPPPPTHAANGSWTLLGNLPPWVTMAEALNLGDRPDDKSQWAWDRPATTVVRSFCPDIIAAPGYRVSKEHGSRQNAPGSIRVTPEQLCILQGIRTDYPFTASQSKTLSLIGAILPPPWAAAILAPVATRETTCAV